MAEKTNKLSNIGPVLSVAGSIGFEPGIPSSLPWFVISVSHRTSKYHPYQTVLYRTKLQTLPSGYK